MEEIGHGTNTVIVGARCHLVFVVCSCIKCPISAYQDVKVYLSWVIGHLLG